MKIYLDLVFILNFFFDLILLISVASLLRRNIPLKRLILGSLVGGISIFILFIKISSFELFLIKIFISIIMTLTAFGFKDIKYFFKNLIYLYISSTIMGGILYFLNLQFSYKNNGLVFYHHSISINWIIILIFTPIIIFLYIKELKKLKSNYSKYYPVDIYLRNGKMKKLTGFLDTGNALIDPYKKRPIILVNEIDIPEYNDDDVLLVPYDSLNFHGLLRCIIPLKVNIIGIGIKKNILLGLSKEKIKTDGVNCILHPKLMEE